MQSNQALAPVVNLTLGFPALADGRFQAWLCIDVTFLSTIFWWGGQIHWDFALAEVASNIKCMFGYITHLISGVLCLGFQSGEGSWILQQDGECQPTPGDRSYKTWNEEFL